MHSCNIEAQVQQDELISEDFISRYLQWTSILDSKQVSWEIYNSYNHVQKFITNLPHALLTGVHQIAGIVSLHVS